MTQHLPVQAQEETKKISSTPSEETKKPSEEPKKQIEDGKKSLGSHPKWDDVAKRAKEKHRMKKEEDERLPFFYLSIFNH